MVFTLPVAQRVVPESGGIVRGKAVLRFDMIETDACRKFHMDQVTTRLLMPLSGSGTQWIDVSLGSDAPINQFGVGDVEIFKGWR